MDAATTRGFSFEVIKQHVQVSSSDQVSAAVRHLSLEEVDVIAIVRGGGEAVGLSAFNDKSIAREISISPKPVITGLGHAEHGHVADEFATERFITPTDVTVFLVETVRSQIDDISRAAKMIGMHAKNTIRAEQESLRHFVPRLHSEVRRSLDNCGSSIPTRSSVKEKALLALQRCEGSMHNHSSLEAHCNSRLMQARQSNVVHLGSVHARLHNEHRNVEGLRMGLAARAHELLEQSEFDVEQVTEKSHSTLLQNRGDIDRYRKSIEDSAKRRLEQDRAQMAALRQRTQDLDPQNLLARGLTITRDENGQIIKDASAVADIEKLVTQFRDGSVVSTIDQLKEN